MANPLTDRRAKFASSGFPLTFDDLAAYADQLNEARMYRDQGVRWVVVERPNDDGALVASLEKRTGRPAQWKPEPGEMEATAAVIARHAESTITQEQFNSLVRRGAISHEIVMEMGK